VIRGWGDATCGAKEAITNWFEDPPMLLGLEKASLVVDDPLNTVTSEEAVYSPKPFGDLMRPLL
jgi:hypothetical protein